MASFPNTSATHYFPEALIKDARDRLVLISPFLRLNDAQLRTRDGYFIAGYAARRRSHHAVVYLCIERATGSPMALSCRFTYHTPLYYSARIHMSHTIRGKSKLLARVRRIRGQVEALERALEAEKGCAVILHQIAAARGAINGLMAEVLEAHVRTHITDPAITSDAERTQGADELIEVLRTYIK